MNRSTKIKKYGIFVIIFSINAVLNAQQLLGLQASWSDSFIEWNIDAEPQEDNSTLNMVFQPNDWSQWAWRMGEKSGSVRQKWKNDPSEWEATGDNKIVTARRIYPSEWREWRISDGKNTLELRCKYGNQTTEWEANDPELGNFRMFQTYARDPRDWTIEDDLDEKKISLSMRIVLTFLIMYHSVPRH